MVNTEEIRNTYLSFPDCLTSSPSFREEIIENPVLLGCYIIVTSTVNNRKYVRAHLAPDFFQSLGRKGFGDR